MIRRSDVQIRKDADRRRKGLAGLREPWEEGNAEVARFTQRFLSGYVADRGSRSRLDSGQKVRASGKANNRLYNSRAVWASGVLANGMSSGMSSPSQPWFKFQASDPGLRINQAAKEWCDDVTEVVTRFMHGTNIYQAMQQGYGELGNFGVEAGLLTSHYQYGAVAYPLTWGEYWLGSDDGLRVNTLARDCSSMTVGQAVETWGKEKLHGASRRLADKEKWDAQIPIMHIIEPNTEREFGKIDQINKPYRSVYWQPDVSEADKDRAGILDVSGFDRKPFYTPRWQTVGMDPYGYGPGFIALPESRKAQLQEVRYQASMDYGVRPPLLMASHLRNNQANLNPSGITFASAQDMQNAAMPIWTVEPQTMNFIAQDIVQRTEPAIDRSFFTQLFMAISGMPGVQPRTVEEIVKRYEEQLSQLGPVVERVSTEKLSVIVMQFFAICSDLGMIPPVPDSLDGQEIQLKFTGVLAQAQERVGLSSIEQAIGFAGNVAGVRPDILDNIDFDETLRLYWERMGVPAKTLRAMEDVESVRQSRAQQEQQAQMAAMMPAVKDGADAAQLLSQTDVAGRPLLDAMMQPGV